MKKNEKILDMIGQADEKYIPEVKKMQDNKKEKNVTDKINKEGSEDKKASVIVVKNSKRNNFIKWFAVCGGICASLVLMIHLRNNKPSDINNDSLAASISTVTTVTEPVVSQTETKVSETSTTEVTKKELTITRGTYINFLSMDGEVTDSILLENAAPTDFAYFDNQVCFTDEKMYYFMRGAYNLNGGGRIYEVDRKTSEYTPIEDERIGENDFQKITFDKEGKLYYFYSKSFSDEHEPLKKNSHVCEINSELELVNERSVNEIFGYEEFNLCDVVFDEDNIMYCMYKINDDFYIGKAKLTSGEFLGSQLIASGEYYNSIIDIDSFGNILTGMVKSVDNGAVYSIDSYDTDTLTMLSHNEFSVSHNEYDEYTRSGYDGFTHGAGGYDFILVNGRTFKGYDAGTNTLTELFTKELSEREKSSAYGNYLMAMAYEDQLIICEKYLKEG